MTKQTTFHTATVAAVESGGLRLIFPDRDEAGPKLYPYNKSLTFSPGQRVLLLPSGDSYVVAFPI